MHTCLLILITLLLSVLGFGPDAKADVRDHLGGTRAVIDDTEELLQTVNYYPYGMPFPETANIQPYKYSQKELDMANDLNQYDFGARWYSHSTALFTTQYPLAEKYYALSPYTYCGDNPINNVDINGDSIAVILDQSEHLALLIQNPDGKWAYFSLNGDWIFTYSYGSSGGKDYFDLGEKTFDNVSDFLTSEYNQSGNKKQLSANERSGFNYSVAYVLPSSQEQDVKMQNKFKSVADKGYNLISNQCAHAVQKTMAVAGFNLAENPYLPSKTFNSVITKFPYGYLYKK